ncbi:hypothetical protein K1719_046002 [Acacia pycnantha]|nr:hypothetical protein K1719_046002 [Acacia pycnantha]
MRNEDDEQSSTFHEGSQIRVLATAPLRVRFVPEVFCDGEGEGVAGEEEDAMVQDSPAKTSSDVSLKDQLKKKSPEDGNYLGKLRSDPNFSQINYGRKDLASAPKTSPKYGTTITDGDWTQLLSIPNPITASGSNHSNGVIAPGDLNKNSRRQYTTSHELSGTITDSAIFFWFIVTNRSLEDDDNALSQLITPLDSNTKRKTLTTDIQTDCEELELYDDPFQGFKNLIY